MNAVASIVESPLKVQAVFISKTEFVREYIPKEKTT